MMIGGSASLSSSESQPHSTGEQVVMVDSWWEQQLEKVKGDDASLETVFTRRVLEDAELESLALAMNGNTHVRQLFVNPPKQISTATMMAKAIKESKLSGIHFLCFRADGSAHENVMKTLYSEGIQHCNSLRELRITGNIGHIDSFNDVLPCLRVLCLQQVDTNQLQNLRRGLVSSPSLREVRLINYQLQDDDFTLLGSTSIKALTLHNCVFNGDFLENWLPESHLIELTLSKCNLEAGRALSILRATAGHRTLKTLSLNDNHAIGYPGLQLIATLLATNTLTLEQLELAHCASTSSGLDSSATSTLFLEAMEANTHLCSLDLTRNGLNIDGSSQKFHQAIQSLTAPAAFRFLLTVEHGAPPEMWSLSCPFTDTPLKVLLTFLVLCEKILNCYRSC